MSSRSRAGERPGSWSPCSHLLLTAAFDSPGELSSVPDRPLTKYPPVPRNCRDSTATKLGSGLRRRNP